MIGKILAIDYGTLNVGLAISDPDRILAFPRATLKNDKELLTKLRDLILEEKVSEVVIGLPLATDNRNLPITEKVELFAAELRDLLPETVEIVLQDEKLTSVDALERIKSAPQKLVNTDKDQIAALIILEERMMQS